MSNIEGLNEEESKWVCEVMSMILGGCGKHGKCPSEKAWDRFQDNLTQAGFQDKNIPYRS